MTAAKWDELPADWSVRVEPVDDPGAVSRKHPLASKGGMQALQNILAADVVWRNLTRPQRELLLSTAAGYPIKARADVTRRLTDRGLLAADSSLTEAGRFVVAWRLP